MAILIDTQIQFLKGVGPKLGGLLARKGIVTVGDLLEWYPRAFEDRRAGRTIKSLKPGELVSIVAYVKRVSSIPMGRSRRKMYEIMLKDETGQIPCKYFRVPYKGYFDRFQQTNKVTVSGKVTLYRNVLQFQHPDIQHFSEEDEEAKDTLIPIYSEIEGLTSSKIKRLIDQAVNNLIDHPEEVTIPKHYSKDVIDSIREKRVSGIPETLPDSILKAHSLLSRSQAVKEIHQPLMEYAAEYLKYRAPAQRRIIFDEFFSFELYMARQRSGVKLSPAHAIKNKQTKAATLIQSLPFELTSAQMKVYKEVVEDMAIPSPMNRLIQGDVGSGKTLVALLAGLVAIESQFQVALMVPTEILAEQHLKSAKNYLEPLGIRVNLITGQMKASEAKQVKASLAAGEIDLIIGTHALIQKGVEFKNLGLVIIDEQHRFGVDQRSQLRSKGKFPHFLVMTATPIPRTLAMTVYGDLDVSIIDELPKGRQPIVTRKVFENKRDKVLGFVAEQISKGRQAYVVYPLVQESEKIELKNAIDEFEKLKKEFPQFNVGLLHGRMKPAEKEAVMSEFYKNKIQILVSTTVIEVGVDVPNANIMLIEHAERFGLSQLHQLRGRVGRGEHKSYCILMNGYAVSEEGQRRAEIMEETSDGFKIAEADLEMRGPGEFLGKKQSGLPGFKMAHIIRDHDLLEEAREAAFALIKKDPDLSSVENKPLAAVVEKVAEVVTG